MSYGNHFAASILCAENAPRPLHKVIVLAAREPLELVILPVGFPVAERGPDGVVRRSLIFVCIPRSLIVEVDRPIPGNEIPAQQFDLLGEPPRIAPVVIVPMRDDLSACVLAAQVPLLPDPPIPRDANPSDLWIIGEDACEVCPASVLEDQHLLQRVRLLLEALYRLRQILQA